MQAKPSVEDAFAVKKLITLVKDNQLVTAMALFILWQMGTFGDVAGIVGGMC